jgi:tetratricopeptide (TPR) repeat protein
MPWQARFAGAEAHFAAGAIAEAEAAYHAVIADAPRHLPAYIGAARCARKRHDHAAALACFDAAATFYPAHVGVQMERSQDLTSLGRFDDADAAYHRVLALAPDHVAAQLGLAKSARRRGDRAAALRAFEAAAAAAPENPWPVLDIAAEHLALGAVDAAEAAYGRAVLLARDNPNAWIGLGQCARKRGDRNVSLAIFQAGRQAVPGNATLTLEAAADLRELGALDDAATLYRQVLAAAPDNAQAHLGLGHCARKRGDHQAAVPHVRAAIRAAPANPWPLLDLAADLRALGDLNEAEQCCRRALALAPDNVQAHLSLGHCARARGDRAAALAHYQAASRVRPDDAAPWLDIAAEQRERGDLAAARDAARHVLAREPAHLQAWLSLGRTERADACHEAALAAFTQAHQAHPAQAEPLVEMAIEARSLGRQAECDALLARARAADPRNIPAIVRLAEQAMSAGDFAAAYDIYRQAIVDQPEQIAFHLGAVDTHIARGARTAALDALQALETRHGPLPAILAKRVHLLRRCGENHLALRYARAATAAHPEQFTVWVERFLCELLVGTDSDVDACLAALPAATARQTALLHRFRGNAAEARWQLADARGHYKAAAALHPQDAGTQHDLVRVNLLLLRLQAARLHLQRACQLTAHITRLKGKSLNISQTHFGQIIDDYTLDRNLLAQLAAVQALPPPQRVAALRPLVRQNPDNNAAAISLLVALRQAGAFAAIAAGSGGKVPAYFAQFWDAPEPPPDIADIMQSWRDANPDLTFQLFNDRTARTFLAEHYTPPVLAAYRRAREPAQKADIFRLAFLAAHGGIYADADDRCLQPLATILPANAELVLYQEDHGTLGNNFIAAMPGHPILVRALNLAVTAINRGDTDMVWLSTGPALLTRAFAQYVAERDAGSDIAVLDRRQLFQAVAIHCAASYKSTDLHWSNTTFARRGHKRR